MANNQREMDPMVPRDEYDRIVRELRSAENEVRVLRERLDRRNLAARVARRSVHTAAAAAVCLGLWIGLFRGCAFGESARRNAEREALSYAERKYGERPMSVWCEEHAPGDEMICYARLNGRQEPVSFYCDDDEKSHNDGCVADQQQINGRR